MKSIEESMKDRKDLLEYFGGILPESIMKHNRGDSAINFISKGKGKRSRATKFKEGIKKEFDNGNFDFTIAKRSTPATKETLSMFSQNIGRTLIKLYSKENDIIIDPFAGHNSRMQLCFESNRNYYGQDICHEFMEMNRQVKDILINEKSIFLDKKVSINLFEGDSRKLPWNNNFGDFSITSPPYYDMEKYGDEKEQLGFCKTYKDFLNDMKLVISETYRCLKTGAYCAWFINDFRRGGVFYNYHGDTIELMKSIGFIQKDIIIVDFGPSIYQIFASEIIKNKILGKRHEYGLIFKKE